MFVGCVGAFVGKDVGTVVVIGVGLVVGCVGAFVGKDVGIVSVGLVVG